MKHIITLFFLSVNIINAFPQIISNSYGNGNGTIIEIITTNEIKWIRRQHNQFIRIGDLSRPERLIVYTNPQLGNYSELFRINYGDYIEIIEVIREEQIANNEFKIWLKIIVNNGDIGWINIDGRDPYENDNWTFIENIYVINRIWTIRKLYFSVAIWETLEVRNKPGLYGSEILFNLVPILPKDNEGATFFYNGFAATEKKDTIDGRTEHWVKIECIDGRTGWIFGGYGSAERGGPTYWTPENIIHVRLGPY